MLPTPGQGGAKQGSEAALKAQIADLEARLQRQSAEIDAVYALLGRERAQRVRAEAALSTANQIVEGIFAHAPMALQIFDREGFSFRMNERNRALMGLPEHGKDSFNILTDPLSDDQEYIALYERAYTGKVVAARELTLTLAPETPELSPRTLRIEQAIFPIFDEDEAISAVIACTVERRVDTPPKPS